MLMYRIYSLLFLLWSTLQTIQGQQIESTLDGAYFFLVFDKQITTQYLYNNISIAHHEEYAFTWGANANILDMYADTNPQMALSFYFPFERDPDFRSLWWWQNYHPTWVVYQCDGITPAYLDYDPKSCNNPIVLDISNPEVIDWQVEMYAMQAAKLGYTWLAADNFFLGNGVDACGVYSRNGTWVRKYIGNGTWTDPAFASDVLNWLEIFQQRIKQLSPPLNLAVNFVIDGQDAYDGDILQMTKNVDAILDEGGVTQWASGLPDEEMWLITLNYMELVQSMGKAYFIINENEVVNQSNTEYEMASYFMSKNQAAAIAITTIQGYGIETFLPEYANLNIGSPLGPKYKAKGLYWRQYTNGTVVVNADPESAVFVVEQDCVDAYGQIYNSGSSLTFDYHDAKVLAFIDDIF